MSKTQTELFVSKWQIHNFEALFCWKQRLNKRENWIVCFLKEKITLKHLKTIRSSDPRVHLKIFFLLAWYIMRRNTFFSLDWFDNLSHSKWSFLFHQKIPLLSNDDLKTVWMTYEMKKDVKICPETDSNAFILKIKNFLSIFYCIFRIYIKF